MISVTTDEDLENMIKEYNRLTSNNLTQKSSQLCFATRDGFSKSATGELFTDDDVVIARNENSSTNEVKSSSNNIINKQGGGGVGQDVHSVPDSPMLEMNSSFGSASSSSSLANLPPIRVHVVEDQKVTMGSGIEDQFSQMSVRATTSTTIV
ncbi:hypothetical protein TEA_000832 [Camellia sinensis var. sinensis]|uniref:PB1 domain-containing protein n=1 Tax=Camellia sinensis var. sinensis TaxID=542762 RepID=A0A4V6RYB0_CAMSN|nr:hypothetical protein TEA_000832 [Camellia sinensis var. sinensis]